jgi:hypothetical protein
MRRIGLALPIATLCFALAFAVWLILAQRVPSYRASEADPTHETPCNPGGSACCWDGWNDCGGDDRGEGHKPAHAHRKRVAARERNQACDVCDDGVPYCDDGTACPDTTDDDPDSDKLA